MSILKLSAQVNNDVVGKLGKNDVVDKLDVHLKTVSSVAQLCSRQIRCPS